MKTNTALTVVTLLSFSALPVAAEDNVNGAAPSQSSVKSRTEKPHKLTPYIAPGWASRQAEAVERRAATEKFIAEDDWEQALTSARRAVLLDPGDPSGHQLFANSLTQKVLASQDEKLLVECITEWKLIRRHHRLRSVRKEAKQRIKQLAALEKSLKRENITSQFCHPANHSVTQRALTK